MGIVAQVRTLIRRAQGRARSSGGAVPIPDSMDPLRVLKTPGCAGYYFAAAIVDDDSLGKPIIRRRLKQRLHCFPGKELLGEVLALVFPGHARRELCESLAWAIIRKNERSEVTEIWKLLRAAAQRDETLRTVRRSSEIYEIVSETRRALAA